jgi:hypothetical protein
MIAVSFSFLIYIVVVNPYDDPFLNKLEIFNELIILSCLYHALTFVPDAFEINPALLY